MYVYVVYVARRRTYEKSCVVEALFPARRGASFLNSSFVPARCDRRAAFAFISTKGPLVCLLIKFAFVLIKITSHLKYSPFRFRRFRYRAFAFIFTFAFAFAFAIAIAITIAAVSL